MSWGLCWCVSPCTHLPPQPQTSFHLPRSPEPGIHWPWGPCGFRHPALDTGWVVGRSKPGWAATSSLEIFEEMRDRDVSRRKFEDAAGLGGGYRRKCTRLGHSFTPGGCPERPRSRETCPCPRVGPAIHSPWPPGHCHSRRGARGSQALGQPPRPGQPSSGPVQPTSADAGPLAAPWRRPSRREGHRPAAPGSSLRWSGRPLRGSLPPLSLAKSLKAPTPSVTPGASNHPVSISLTLFIPLKTHLKTLQLGVCSGLYPH